MSCMVRNSKDKKSGGEERYNQISMCVCVCVCVYVLCLLGVPSVLLERSSQETNHNPRLGCLLSIYTVKQLCYICFSFTLSISLCLLLFVFLLLPQKMLWVTCVDLKVELSWYGVMWCRAMEHNWSTGQWHTQAFHETPRKICCVDATRGRLMFRFMVCLAPIDQHSGQSQKHLGLPEGHLE